MINFIRGFRGLLACIFWAAASSVAASETQQARYDVRLLGAKLGEMVMASAESATRYSVRSRFRATGAMAALTNAKFDVSAKGRIKGQRLIPQSYSEVTAEGDHATNVQITYSGGMATRISGDTGSKAPPVDPAHVRGALDPLTALYTALRDQPVDRACRLDADVFDGQRHARLSLTQRTAVQGGVECAGQYRRIAGYSSKSRKNRTIPISVRYTAQGQTLRAELVTVRTRYGKVTLHRR